ncbi:MAG: nucleoside 2-deoxyribosyltransferase [Bifidobacterium sp.]|nr:nucleoside 2-deoxyribosyltransferase [Bifidobacterium sp.]
MEQINTGNGSFTSSKPIFDFYVAGPYQTAEQVESMERLEKVLEDRKQRMYQPRFHGDVNVDGPQAVFAKRLDALRNSAAVIANYDDKDPGTIWTIGYAYALGKPVYVYCEGLTPDTRMSLMVAQSATRILTGPTDLEDMLDSGETEPVTVEEY